MTIKKLGPNITELQYRDGTRVLVSYETPVAVRSAMGEWFKSDRFHSRSTAAHVAKWIPAGVERLSVISQDEIDGFMEGR